MKAPQSAQHSEVPELPDLSMPSRAKHFHWPIVLHWASPMNGTNRFLESSPTAQLNGSAWSHAKCWQQVALNDIVQKKQMRYKSFRLEKANQRLCCTDVVRLLRQIIGDHNLCNILPRPKDAVALRPSLAFLSAREASSGSWWRAWQGTLQ